MANFNLQTLADAINTSVEDSKFGAAEVSLGVNVYFDMTLSFDRPMDHYTVRKSISDEANKQLERYLDTGERVMVITGLEYLSINGDEEALTKLPNPGPAQLSKLPTVVKIGPAFKALVRANASEARLLIDQDAPAEQRFVPASVEPEAARNEWQNKMEKVIKQTLAQLEIAAPDSIEDWGDPILELLSEAGLSWPEANEDGREEERQFLNHYNCPSCAHEWSSEWSATCDDECPECGARHISPTTSEEL